MTHSSFCLLRGFINVIPVITDYNTHNWIFPILWINGSFTIFLPHIDGRGHEDLEIIAEAATRFEDEQNIKTVRYLSGSFTNR
jgi:hypothetical protein